MDTQSLMKAAFDSRSLNDLKREASTDPKGKALQVAMLRFLTVDGDVCHFDQPMIEGQLVGFDKGAGFERNRTKPVTFTIQERR